jgi:heme exporter protein CcmD
MAAVPHIEMIVAAYAVAALAIATMIGLVWRDYRALSAEVDDLERNVARREGRLS